VSTAPPLPLTAGVRHTISLATLRSQLKDRWESVPFWSDDEARTALNEAMLWWNLFTGTWRKRVVFGMIRNTHWFALPATLVYNARVQVDETPLHRSSLNDLDYGRPGWDGENTASGGDVPTTPRVWAPAGLTLFAVWPADSAACHTLVIDGIHTTPKLVEDDDLVELDDEDRYAILGEALHIAAFKEGGQRWKVTEAFHKQFLTSAGEQNDGFLKSSYFRKYLGLDVDRRAARFSAGGVG